MFQPDSGFASYPWRLVDGYGQHFAQGGGEFLHENVRRLEPREGGGVRVRSERGIRNFDAVVVAAGAWSGRLAAGLGDRVSLLGACGVASLALAAVLLLPVFAASAVLLIVFLVLRAPLWSVLSTISNPLCAYGAELAGVGTGFGLAAMNLC